MGSTNRMTRPRRPGDLTGNLFREQAARAARDREGKPAEFDDTPVDFQEMRRKAGLLVEDAPADPRDEAIDAFIDVWNDERGNDWPENLNQAVQRLADARSNPQ